METKGRKLIKQKGSFFFKFRADIAPNHKDQATSYLNGDKGVKITKQGMRVDNATKVTNPTTMYIEHYCTEEGKVFVPSEQFFEAPKRIIPDRPIKART